MRKQTDKFEGYDYWNDRFGFECIELVLLNLQNRFERLRHDWLFRCSSCGLLASSLQPSIPRERTETLLDEDARLAGLYEARRRSNTTISQILSRLSGGSERSLLDVGCGHGLFLKDALAAGFRAEGIEPDANVVDQARSETGAPVRHGYFPDVLGADDRFDAIVFNDVLEHIPSVEAAIAACKSHLRPNGVPVLNCPDQDGLFYRLADLLDRVRISGPFLRMWQVGFPLRMSGISAQSTFLFWAKEPGSSGWKSRASLRLQPKDFDKECLTFRANQRS